MLVGTPGHEAASLQFRKENAMDMRLGRWGWLVAMAGVTLGFIVDRVSLA